MIRWLVIQDIREDRVQLRLDKKPSCSGCYGQCQKPLFRIFGTGSESFWLKQNSTTLHMTNPELLFSGGRCVGQKVGVQWSDTQLLKNVFIVYTFPVLLILLMMIFGHYGFSLVQLSGDLGATLGLFFSIGLLIIFGQRLLSPFTMLEVTFL